VQLAELDEHAYHEALVHVPGLSMDAPQAALVVGGGDGGAVRELCRYASLERIDLVEIDNGVIEACSEHMPFLSSGAFNEPRVAVSVADAFEFVKRAEGPYDLIVMDSTDVYEEEDGGLSEMLFTRGFYEDCKRLLSPRGLIVTQADNLIFCPYSMDAIVAELASVFAKVGQYQALVPSFGGFSGFVWASHGAEVSRDFPEERANRLELRYLNKSTWRLAMTPLSFGPDFIAVRS
jgi:spermidine synthase